MLPMIGGIWDWLSNGWIHNGPTWMHQKDMPTKPRVCIYIYIHIYIYILFISFYINATINGCQVKHHGEVMAGI